MLSNKFGYILISYAMVFLRKTTCETCIKFFKNQKDLQDAAEVDTSLIFNPDRVWRYNTQRKEFEKLEYLKSNQSALCSVNFTNDLQGKILKVAISRLDPYSYLRENNTIVSGFLGDVWIILENSLKFRSIYTLSEDVSVLQNGTFDVSLAATILTAQPTVYYVPSTVIGQKSLVTLISFCGVKTQRLDSIFLNIHSKNDFLNLHTCYSHFKNTQIKITKMESSRYALTPQIYRYSLFAVPEGSFVSKWWYIRIFHAYVWILSIIFVILLTLSMVGIYNIKSKLRINTELCREFGYPSFNLLCILGATSGQGFQEIPRSWSLRICTFTALCMGMLLSCGFNSTLTSYLAFRAPFIAIHELDDVWRQNTRSICVRNQTYAYYELRRTIQQRKESKSSKDKKMLLLNRKCPNMANEIEFRQNICHPGFIFIETSDVFLQQYKHVQDKCQIMKVRGSYWSSKISFLHYRGSKYWKLINTYILRLHSSGIIKYLEAKWGFHRDLPYGIYNNYQQVELDHVKLLIIGLFISMIISIIICILENIWFRLHNENE